LDSAWRLALPQVQETAFGSFVGGAAAHKTAINMRSSLDR